MFKRPAEIADIILSALSPFIERLERAEAKAETLRAQLHGLQDGAALRDAEARAVKAEEERKSARKELDEERALRTKLEIALGDIRKEAESFSQRHGSLNDACLRFNRIGELARRMGE